MTIQIQQQEQFGRWHHYQSKQNQADAYRVAKRRAEATKKRDRLVDCDGANWIFSILIRNQNNLYKYCRLT